jgi:CelD/BcsL family acetyltransferase involved in cellulose biosynthesis
MLTWQIDTPGQSRAPGWEAVEEVWRRDAFPSPFASPEFLRALVGEARRDGVTPVFAIGRREGVPAVVWPLALDARRRLQFLQQRDCDHCVCLCAGQPRAGDLADGLLQAMEATRPSGVFLQRVYPAAPTLEAAKLALERRGWACRLFPATPCPVLTVAPGPDAGERLRAELERHRKVNNYLARVEREEGYRFEALECEYGLEEWAEEYCDAHEWRWSRTNTPSRYHSAEARADLLAHLRAWQRDGVLVRFSIRLAAGRAAFVVALRCGDRLVYHHAVVPPALDRHSAGHVLIRLIGGWMAPRGFRTLDFGVGDEDYKLRYVNGNEALFRVYGSPGRVSATSVKALVDGRIRSSRRLQNAWDQWANRRLRGAVLQRLRDARSRWAIVRRVHLAAPPASRLVLLRDRLIVEREIFYRARGTGLPPDPEVRLLSVSQVLRMLEAEQGMLDRSRAAFYEYRFNGSVPFGIVEGGRVVQVSWLSAAGPEVTPGWLKAAPRRLWCIQMCVTARSARGRGLYPRVLRAIRAGLTPEDEVLIYTHTWNRASQKGISKAGFEPFAIRSVWKWSGRRVYEPIDQAPQLAPLQA